MLNQVVLIGRIVEDPKVKKVNDKEVCNLTIASQRSYKNVDGIYETDFIDCTLWNAIATNVVEYCHKGDLVGIKGRLQTRTITDDEGNVKNKLVEVIAEKVTFLSSNTKDIKENDNVKISDE